MEDETRELPYHNKPAWLHHAWLIKFHTAAKPGVKRKRDNDARNKNNEKYEANRKWLFLSSWATDRHRLQNDDEKGMTCKICVEHYRARVKNIFSSQVSKIIKSVQYLTMRNLVCILMQLGVIKSQKQALTQQTTAHLKEHTRKDLELKFRNVHALIKKIKK
jgi:hypothetical protein